MAQPTRPSCSPTPNAIQGRRAMASCSYKAREGGSKGLALNSSSVVGFQGVLRPSYLKPNSFKRHMTWNAKEIPCPESRLSLRKDCT